MSRATIQTSTHIIWDWFQVTRIDQQTNVFIPTTVPCTIQKQTQMLSSPQKHHNIYYVQNMTRDGGVTTELSRFEIYLVCWKIDIKWIDTKTCSSYERKVPQSYLSTTNGLTFGLSFHSWWTGWLKSVCLLGSITFKPVSRSYRPDDTSILIHARNQILTNLGTPQVTSRLVANAHPNQDFPDRPLNYGHNVVGQHDLPWHHFDYFLWPLNCKLIHSWCKSRSNTTHVPMLLLQY